MNESPIIFEGVTLMLLGMGFVFCFLALLVGATRLLSFIAMKFQPSAQPASAPVHTAKGSDSEDDALVAAMSAVLHHHKNKLIQQA